jgi:hypothetical protein
MERKAEPGGARAEMVPAGPLALNWWETELPEATRKANGRAGWLLMSQQPGRSAQWVAAGAGCDGQQGMECGPCEQQPDGVARVTEWVACRCIGAIRTWHFEPWPEAGGIARPASAHRTMTNDSTNDKLLRIALREIMPNSLLLLATQPSVTGVTARWFDGAGVKRVLLSGCPLGGPLFLTIHSHPHSCTENRR